MGFEATTIKNIADIGTTAGMVGTGLSALGAFRGASNNAAIYDYQAQVASNNAEYAGWQERDALRRGQTDVARAGLRTRQLAGAQRAAFASRGVSLDEGSPLNILSDTYAMGEVDIATLKDNTAKEALGFRLAAQNYTDNASMLRSAASNQNPWLAAGGTLLTGAGNVAARWYDNRAKGIV